MPTAMAAAMATGAGKPFSTKRVATVAAASPLTEPTDRSI